MNASRIFALIIGAVLTLVGVLGIVGGAIAWGLDNAQKDQGGYFTSPTQRFSTDSYALTARHISIYAKEDIPIGFNREDIARVKLQASSASEGKSIFIGIAREADVAKYLAGVQQTELTDIKVSPFRPHYKQTAGDAPAIAPTAATFWVASTSGPGMKELTWTPQSGHWSVVIMNADASPGVNVGVMAGIHIAGFGTMALWGLVLGVLFLLVGVFLLVWAAKRYTPMEHASFKAAGAPVRYPAYLRGEVQAPSRWLWLLKWILVIPHYIVLAILWIPVSVLSLISGFAILFTGRYPRAFFDFNVGVLRWSWRVGFYAYSVLGTDQYPPFTLAKTEYPADFDVEYPEKLSHWLWIFKWLLAIPHLIIVSIIGYNIGSWGYSGFSWSTGDENWWIGGGSLLTLLVIIAGVIMLFSGRYPQGLFNFIVGLNRWVYRVLPYVLLMRDEYPPFRLDQGPKEPETQARNQDPVLQEPGEGPSPTLPNNS